MCLLIRKYISEVVMLNFSLVYFYIVFSNAWKELKIDYEEKKKVNKYTGDKYQYISPRGWETLHLGVEHISRNAVWTVKALMDRQITVHTHMARKQKDKYREH